MKNDKFQKVRRRPGRAPARTKSPEDDIFASEPEKEQVQENPPQAKGRDLSVKNVPAALYNQIGDMVYLRITGGELLTTNSTIVIDALKEYFKKHKPKRMPDEIRDQLRRSARRRS